MANGKQTTVFINIHGQDLPLLPTFFDPTDGAMTILGLAFNEPNDGLVGACGAHLGKVIGDDYKMNHLDEINGLLGIHHLFETDFVTLYRQHANRLKLATRKSYCP